MRRAPLVLLLLAAAIATAWVLVARPRPGREPPPHVDTFVAPNYGTGFLDEDLELELSVPVEPPAVATAVVTGRVLTADGGKPVAGATLDYDGRLPFVKSAPDGSFRLEGIPPGRWSIAAFPEAHASASRWIDLAAGGTAHLDLYVLPGAVVEGTVTAAGSPVAGAVVKDGTGTKTAVTGKGGTFVLRGFRPGDEWLEVAAPGFPAQRFNVEIGPGEVRVPCAFELQAPWKAVGRVLLEGKPVAGARVGATSRGIAGQEFAGATTAADGTFAMDAAEDPEEGRIWAWKEGVGLGCSAEVDPADGTILDGVDIALPSSLPVPIVLVDEAGAPVPGAVVLGCLESEETGEIPVDAYAMGLPYEVVLGRTDAGGKAAPLLQAGKWAIGLRADGFFAVDLEAHVGMEFGLPRVPVVLRRGGDLEGRVVDDEARPVAGADVYARGSGEWDRRNVVTGADGQFAFRSLADEDYVVHARKGGFSGGPSKGVRPGRPLTVVLRPASTIRGRVLLPDGRTPARAFTVRLWFEATEDGTPWKDQGWAFLTEEVTDADGRFSLPDVEPGTIGVEAECGDLLSARVSLPTRPGEDPPETTLVLRAAASVAGRVLDPAGAPVAGIWVSLHVPWGGAAQPEDEDEWANVRQAVTGEDGRYAFRVLPPGRYRVTAEVEGFFERVQVLKVAAGTPARADLVLERGGRIQVECADPGGIRVEWEEFVFLEDGDGDEDQERNVEVLRDGERWGCSLLTPEDLSSISGFAPGSWRARISAEGFEPVDLRIVVKEGETTTVKAVLKKSP